MRRQRIAGYIGIIEALTLIVGIGMFATVLSDFTSGDFTTSETVAYVADNQGLLYTWNMVTMVAFGLLLVAFSLALYDRLKSRSPIVAQLSAAFGLIWAALVTASGMVTNVGINTVGDLVTNDAAQAEPVWLAVDAVSSGIGGQMEIVGGIWVLLVSWAGIQSGAIPKMLNYLGVVMGVSALATIVPALEMVAIVFGLGLIIWFVWLGLVMIRDPEPEPYNATQVDTRTLERV